MEQRPSVVTLGVADLERSGHFYENRLGFLRGNSSEEIVFFQINGVIFAVFPRDRLAADAQVSSEESGFRGVTLAHLVDALPRSTLEKLAKVKLLQEN
jgi:catechol 2,3-dioxygenase-like lactoylglutathione lyase family enzyme